MTHPTAHPLVVVPGECLVMFFVRIEQTVNVVAVVAAQFLEGLRAANGLLSFDTLQREEPALEDLLPWAGSV